MTADRYAHLRESLVMHHDATTFLRDVEWCASCARHHAPRAGALCPVCEAERAA